MSTIVERCRNGEIKWPTQVGFDPSLWLAAFSELAEVSIEEARLRDAGIWFHRRFSDIRSRLTGFELESFNKTDFCLGVVGSLNYAAYATSAYIKDLMTKRGVLSYDAGAAEGYEAVVSAARHLLSYPKRFTDTGLEITDKDLQRVNSALALAIVYDNYDGAWAKCLWRGWHVIENGATSSMVPESKEAEELKVIAFARCEDLLFQELFYIHSAWKNAPGDFRDRTCARLLEALKVTPSKDGHITVTLGSPLNNPDIPPRSMRHFLFAREPYLMALAEHKFKTSPQLSIKVLIRAFCLLSSVATLLDDHPENLPFDTTTLGQFAPIFQRDELRRILAESLGLETGLCEEILELLSFRWSPRDDLWLRPLVPLDSARLVMVLPPLTSPNPTWLVEYWMREGAIAVQDRGGPFEEQVRSELADSCKLKNATIHRHSIRLEQGQLFEQVDLVARVGNKIVIGEVKCSVFPTRIQEHVNYEARLMEGAQQASRKMLFAQKCKGTLVRILGKDIDQNRELEFIPVVITNLPLGLGQSFNGVPIVDLITLKRYFDQGELPVRATHDEKNGTITAERLVRFYTSDREAEDNLASFLRAPPSLDTFRSMLKQSLQRWVGLSDWGPTSSWRTNVEPHN